MNESVATDRRPLETVPSNPVSPLDRRRSRVERWRYLLAQLLRRSGACRFFSVDMGDYRLRFQPSSLSAAYWIDPDARTGDERLLRKYLRPGDVYVDVGANIGALALAAARTVGPAGQVYACEAHPKTFKYLLQNLSLNKIANVFALNHGVGDRAGTLFVTDQRDDDANSISPENAGIPVAIKTLDEMLGDKARRIDLLKIDVEGYEKPVVSGGRRVLARTACVYFEVSESHFARYGYATKDLLQTFVELGFGLYRPKNRQGYVTPISVDYTPQHCENLLAIRSLDDFLRKTGFTLRQSQS